MSQFVDELGHGNLEAQERSDRSQMPVYKRLEVIDVALLHSTHQFGIIEFPFMHSGFGHCTRL